MNVYDADYITVPEGSVKRILDHEGIVLWERKPPLYPEPFYVENNTKSNKTLIIIKLDNNAPYFIIEYSTNMTNWYTLGVTSTTAITKELSPGSKLYLRASTNRWCNPGTDSTAHEGWCNVIMGVPKVGGNIMSLLYGSEFTGDETDFKTYSTKRIGYEFNSLFSHNTQLEDASELILPATKTRNSCYSGMFRGCGSLVAAPTLPATTLAPYCYSGMFAGCSSLKYIKCLYPHDVRTFIYTSSWVNGVAAQGTFVKDARASWSTGTDYIPSGWTVQDL